MGIEFVTTHASREDGSQIHFYKYETKDKSPVFYMMEIWKEDEPANIIYKKYNITDLDQSMSEAKKIIEQNIKKKRDDLIFSFQIDIDGGAPTFYGYKNGEKKAPPNAYSPIYKKPLDAAVEILTMAKKTGVSIYYQKSLASPGLVEQFVALKNTVSMIASNNGNSEFVDAFKQSSETNVELAFE